MKRKKQNKLQPAKLRFFLLSMLILVSFGACGTPKNTEPTDTKKGEGKLSQEDVTTPPVQEDISKDNISQQPATSTNSSSETDEESTSWIDQVPDGFVLPENDPLPDGLEYTTHEVIYGVEITGYHGTATDLVLPRILEWMDVNKISDYAFKGCNTLRSVTIPNQNMSFYGLGYFSDCTNLEEVILPDNMTRLSDKIFSGCTSLKHIDLPETITYVGSSAFSGCSSLEEITIPSGVDIIGPYAFMDCSSLRQISVPEGVTKLTGQTFWGCNNLETIEIQGTITEIGVGTFAECSSLKSISFSEGLTSINSIAFYECTSLRDITLPESVTSITWDAFDKCSSSLVFHVKEGSYAHEFALSNGFSVLTY